MSKGLFLLFSTGRFVRRGRQGRWQDQVARPAPSPIPWQRAGAITHSPISHDFSHWHARMWQDDSRAATCAAAAYGFHRFGPYHRRAHRLLDQGTLFEREGEEAFRAVEEATLDDLTRTGGGAVLSTGGGAVLRPATRMRLRERGQVVYLHALPDDIYRRLRHDTTRPLLQTKDPLQQLRSLYAQRDPLYRETAHFVIETGRPSVATLVNMVVMQLELAGALNAGALGGATQPTPLNETSTDP